MDIPDRDSLEARLARELARVLRGDMGRLIELMGDPPNLANLPPNFWDEAGQELRHVLTPFLERVYLDQAGNLISSTGIGVDWALVNQRAIDWASVYTFNLVQGITQTSQQTLSRALSAYYRDGLTRGDLEKLISPTFGPVRAEMIAVTEITRASSQGELALVEEISKYGLRMRPIWQTNNDDLVCILCGPRNGKEIRDGQFPPIHVRCRCWVNHEIIEVEQTA
jgi:hypothetical protein